MSFLELHVLGEDYICGGFTISNEEVDVSPEAKQPRSHATRCF